MTSEDRQISILFGLVEFQISKRTSFAIEDQKANAKLNDASGSGAPKSSRVTQYRIGYRSPTCQRNPIINFTVGRGVPRPFKPWAMQTLAFLGGLGIGSATVYYLLLQPKDNKKE
ncbi:hypothetical protein F5Y02DRAFT_421250 [Annulohypoxylon stygium]|nr:hypothetical protein F5Y02DRAFT_421250 [Annulohypoxylon stygium]